MFTQIFIMSKQIVLIGHWIVTAVETDCCFFLNFKWNCVFLAVGCVLELFNYSCLRSLLSKLGTTVAME